MTRRKFYHEKVIIKIFSYKSIYDRGEIPVQFDYFIANPGQIFLI